MQVQSLNPFPGLRPFRQDEDYLFFGREDQTMQLLRRLGNHRFVAVVGSSGSGKSSLVRCGLLSELQGGKMLRAGPSWEIAVTHPGGNPLALLVEAFLEADLYDPEQEDAREQLLATLSRSHFGLVEAIKQARLPEGTNFLLVVDQFEEVFRFKDAGQTQQEVANEFISMLLEAASQSEVPIYIVLTMRSDFIGDCGQFEGLAEAVSRGEFLIPRLTREQYKRVIDGPIKVAGGQIAPRLLQRLLNDLGEQADQLPCLQHSLMRTWSVWSDRNQSDALDLEDYERVGKMSQALSQHADEVYESLANDHQRQLCAGLFKALTVQESEQRGIRRPQRLGRLCQILDVPSSELVSVIDAYRQHGVTFLMPSPEVELQDNTIIDISHESLMRVWTRLRHWVEEEAQSVRIYTRLSESAALHAQGKAGLYRDPELGIALGWLEENKPNEAWAQRYHTGFSEAIDFLSTSQGAAKVAEREREAARQRELAQAKALAATQQAAARNFKRFSAAMVVIALLALAAMFSALVARRNANHARQEVARSLSSAHLIRANHFIENENSLQGLQYLVSSHQHNPMARAPLRRLASVLVSRPIPLSVREITRGTTAIVSTATCGDFLAVGYADGMVTIHGLGTGELLNTLENAEGSAIVHLTFSKDGQIVAAATGRGHVHAWSLDNGTQIADIDLVANPRVTGIALVGAPPRLIAELTFSFVGRWLGLSDFTGESPKTDYFRTVQNSPAGVPSFIALGRGTEVITGTSSSQLSRFDLAAMIENGGPLQPFLPESNQGEDAELITALQISPDGQWLVMAAGNQLLIRSLEDNQQLAAVPWTSGTATNIQFSADAKRVIVSASDGTARILRTHDQQPLTELQNTTEVRESWFSPDGLLVLTVSIDMKARLWNAETGDPLSDPFAYFGPFGKSPFLADGRTILARQTGNRLRILQTVAVPQLPLEFGHDQVPNDVCIGPDGKLLVTACEDGQAYVWDATDASLQSRVAHSSPLTSIRISSDGGRILTVTSGGVAHLYDANTRREVARLAPVARIRNAEFSADGQSILVHMGMGIVQVFHASTGEPRCQPLRNETDVHVATVSHDGRRVATATAEGEIVVWAVDNNRSHRIDLQADQIAWLQFAPTNGQKLACVTSDGSLRVVSADAGRVSLEITHEIRDARWAQDEQTILTISADRSVRVWDANNAEMVSLILNDLPVRSAQFDQLGERILTVSGDSARIWESETGEPLSAPLAHPAPIVTANFNPDDRYVVTACEDRSVRLWPVDSIADDQAGEAMIELANAISEDQQVHTAVAQAEEGPSLLELKNHTADPMLKWYFSQPQKQKLSPHFQITLSKWFDRSWEQLNLDGLRWAALTKPDDALGRARLALGRVLQSNTSLSGFYSTNDLNVAITQAPEAAEIWFYRALAFDRMRNTDRARRSYARMRELQEPSLATLRERLALLDEAFPNSGSMPEASKALKNELLDRAIQLAGRRQESNTTDALLWRVARLDARFDDGQWDEAKSEWALLSKDPSLDAEQARRLLIRYLDGIAEEFDRATPEDQSERTNFYTAAFLLRWLLQIDQVGLAEALTFPPRIPVTLDTIVAEASPWKYAVEGSVPEDDWRNAQFDDSSWKAGIGPLGFSNQPATRLQQYDQERDQITTYYFRHKFSVDSLAEAKDLLFDVLRDDGVIVYLNGNEIFRMNMPEGRVEPETFASATVGGQDEQRYFQLVRKSSGLKPDENVLAAEVHQVNARSSDLGFDLSLRMGRAAGTFLRELSDEAWRKVMKDLASLVPASLAASTGNAARFVFEPQQSDQGSLKDPSIWLARVRFLLVTDQLPEAKKSAERAVAQIQRNDSSQLTWFQAARLLQSVTTLIEQKTGQSATLALPPRDPSLDKTLVDLGPHYNASPFVGIHWHGNAEVEDRLFDLPPIIHSMSGVQYDVRGIIQLNSGIYPPGTGAQMAGNDVNARYGKNYPDMVRIPLGRKASRLHFLHSTMWGRNESGGSVDVRDEGRRMVVARYVFHYADGTSVDLPIHMGHDVIDWRQPDTLANLTQQAWSNHDGITVLQEKTWRNPEPDKVITHIDFVSGKKTAAPFLMGLTLDEN